MMKKMSTIFLVNKWSSKTISTGRKTNFRKNKNTGDLLRTAFQNHTECQKNRAWKGGRGKSAGRSLPEYGKDNGERLQKGPKLKRKIEKRKGEGAEGLSSVGGEKR